MGQDGFRLEFPRRSLQAGGERWKSFERNNTENTNHVGLGGAWKYAVRPEQCIEPRVYSTFI